MLFDQPLDRYEIQQSDLRFVEFQYVVQSPVHAFLRQRSRFYCFLILFLLCGNSRQMYEKKPYFQEKRNKKRRNDKKINRSVVRMKKYRTFAPQKQVTYDEKNISTFTQEKSKQAWFQRKNGNGQW